MEKIINILKSFGINWYEEIIAEPYSLFKDNETRREFQYVLDELIFRGSFFVSVFHPKNKRTFLHKICTDLGKTLFVQKLIDCGANVDAKDVNGKTPLILAVGAFCRYVKNNIFNVKIQNKINEKMNIIKLLIKNKANIQARDKFGESVLHKALDVGCLQLIEALLEKQKSSCIEEPGDQNYTKINIEERYRNVIMYFSDEPEYCIDPTTNFSLLLKFLILQLGFCHNDRAKRNNLNALFLHTLNIKDISYDVNAYYRSETLLHIASRFGTPTMISALIYAGADPTIPGHSYTKRLPIVNSIIFNKIRNLECFLDNGVSVNIVEENDKEANTLLHYAVRIGDLKMIAMLIRKGANVNAISLHRSPLLIACGSISSEKWGLGVHKNNLALSDIRSGHSHFPRVCDVNIVRYLLENGSDMEFKNLSKRTALDHSCRFGKLEIVKLLLSRGAKLKKRGFTTLHYAITGRNPDVVKLVLEKGAKVNYNCTRKGTPLQYVIKEIKENCFEIVKILLSYKADVNLLDKKMNSPLHLACHSYKTDAKKIQMYSGNAAIIKELLNSNANINSFDRSGRTPLQHAYHNYIIMREAGRQDIHNPYKIDLEVLVVFVAGMISRKKYVNEENLLLLENKEIAETFDKYRHEINGMKVKVINSLHISCLDILSMDMCALGRFLSNCGVTEALSSLEYKNKFPYFGIILEERIQEAQKRQPLIEIVLNIFSELMEVDIPFEIVSKICSLLTLKDLYNFDEAYALLTM